MILDFTLLMGEYSIYRFKRDSPTPGWIYDSDFYSVTRTSDALSIICKHVDLIMGIDMKNAIIEAGGELKNVIRTRIFLRNISDWEIWVSCFLPEAGQVVTLVWLTPVRQACTLAAHCVRAERGGTAFRLKYQDRWPDGCVR